MKTYLFRTINSNHGLSLSSALVGIAITSIMLLGIAEGIRVVHSQNKLFNNKEDFKDLAFLVQDSLQKQSKCRPQFINETLDINNRIELRGNNASPQTIELKNNSFLKTVKLGNLQVRNIRVLLLNELSTNLYSAFLLLSSQEVALRNKKDLNFKEISIPMNIEYGATGIDNCNTINNNQANYNINLIENSDGSNEYLKIPSGKCLDNEYVQGITGSGTLICRSLASNNPSPQPSSWSINNPGPGCDDTRCRTNDYGPCTATRCVTNGNWCDGSKCVARGPNARCNGSECCAGPTCPDPRD